MRQIHVLSLGAGVQSTALYLMFREKRAPAVQCAVFADTGEEPAAVYEHLDWLQSLNDPPIYVLRSRRLGDELVLGRASGSGFASIPAFTAGLNGERGMARRQCSREYKVDPIKRFIRRSLAGCAPGRALPRNTEVHQYIGISLDEQARADRIARHQTKRGWRVHFPLIELKMTRKDCLEYLASRMPHQAPRSACVFCPYRSDAEWAHLRHNDQKGWDRAVAVDRALRSPGCRASKDMRHVMFVHHSRRPLEDVEFAAGAPNPALVQLSMGLNGECEGVCGV